MTDTTKGDNPPLIKEGGENHDVDAELNACNAASSPAKSHLEEAQKDPKSIHPAVAQKPTPRNDEAARTIHGVAIVSTEKSTSNDASDGIDAAKARGWLPVSKAEDAYLRSHPDFRFKIAHPDLDGKHWRTEDSTPWTMLPLGIAEPQRQQVALFAGYTNIQSAGFKKTSGQLKGEGMIEYPCPKTMKLTSKALQTLSPVKPPADNKQVQQRLSCLLAPKIQEIFFCLDDGRSHTRQDVGNRTGYTNVQSSGFKKSMSTLSGLGLVTYPDRDTVKLTDLCFPFGRP